MSTSTRPPPQAPAPGRRPGRGRRRLLVLVAVLLLLVAVFFLGGGWYFSSVIHDDALKVKHEDPTADLALSMQGDRVLVTTADDGDRDRLASGATYGLAWEGGYGQVSGEAIVEGDSVTRDLEMLEGTPPAQGTSAYLDRDAFPDDPTVALDQPVEDLTVRSGKAALPAWFVPGADSTWAVLVHGKGGTRAEMLRMMRTTVEAGLPSLAITYRNDEGVPKDPSQHYQYGRTEWRDLAAAVDLAESEGAEQVVLVGASMGGGIVASYLRHVPDAPVAAVVLDAPMLDFGETISFGATQRDLPLFGQVPAPLTWIAKRLTTVRDQVDWDAVDYLTDSSWVSARTLVFHGTDDQTVPISTSRDLAEEHPGEVQLIEIAGAEHVGSWNSDPEAYDATLAEFLAPD